MFLSKTEVDLAIKLSEFAFNKALEGESNKVVTIEYKNKKFSFNLFPIDSIANKERKLDLEYIDNKKHIIKDSYIDYILPLIDGEDGLIDVYKCDWCSRKNFKFEINILLKSFYKIDINIKVVIILYHGVCGKDFVRRFIS